MIRRNKVVRGTVKALIALALFATQQACSLDVGGLAPSCEEDPASCAPPPEMSSPNSYVCECSCDPDDIKVDFRVAANTDDAEENLTSHAVSTTGKTLDFPYAGATEQLVGVRFPGVTIPKGAIIKWAYMQSMSATDTSAAPVVTVDVYGEASDNAAPFAAMSKDLSSRQFTNASAFWTLQPWKLDVEGIDQATGDLSPVIQEIVNRSGWASGNALVLLIKKEAGTGGRAAYPYDVKPMNAPHLFVTYEDPMAKRIEQQEIPVCLPEALNPNRGGKMPQDLRDDCQYRVGATFSALAGACNYPTNHCGCSVKPNSTTFAAKCDTDCPENPLSPDCKNFDPVNHVVEATNVPGDTPVCLANCPITFNMFGRRSECQVEGIAFAQIGDDEATPSARGTILFRGDPCPFGDCALGMEYNINVDDFRFETLFGGQKFEELTAIGESIPGNEAVISRTGDASFAPGDLVSSARGRLGREQQALGIGNKEQVDFNVKFGADKPTCSVHGTMVGGASEGAGDEGSPVKLGIALEGKIVNQPPTANAGQDQTVQCPARVKLDGSASSDFDDNIAVYTWMRGSRAGNKVGSLEVSNVDQRPGKETYVLRVIDTKGQTDEDSTEVNVVDTAAPQVTCSTRVGVFTMPTHAMADVGLTGSAHDSCEGDLPVKVSVFSDEADDTSKAGGNLSPDGQSFALSSLKLRQERNSNGDGRVYLIRAEATDSTGNRGVDCCTVVVPQSSSRASLLAAQKQGAAARNFCIAHQGSAPAGFFAVKDAAKPAPKPR